LSDVAAFHAQTFRPSRSALVVAGAASHEALLQLAAEAFGDWTDDAAGIDGQVVAAADIKPAEPRRHMTVVAREGAAQSELRIGHLSARRDTPDYASLIVMNAILGGQFVSRINLKLRE